LILKLIFGVSFLRMHVFQVILQITEHHDVSFIMLTFLGPVFPQTFDS